MQKTLEQFYDGELFLHECVNVKIAGYKEAKSIAFEAHEIFEDKLSQAMKEELDDFCRSKQMWTALSRHKHLLTALSWVLG